MTDWWSNIEKEIDRLSATAPDPWAGADAAPLALTPDQIAFLEQLLGVSDAFVRHDEWDDVSDDDRRD
jgi:hypothetical protein